ACGAETEMARGRRKCPENGHGVHACRILIAMANSDGLVVPVAIRDGEAICEKDQIKPATLENTCDLDIVVGRKERHGMRRVTPQRVAVRYRACDQETRKVHSAPALAHDATPSFARSLADRTPPAKASGSATASSVSGSTRYRL